MLIVELQAQSNGARGNMRYDLDAPPVPEGWAAVPEELEEKALAYLPFLELTVEAGVITAVAPGERPAEDPAPQPDDLTQIQLAVAELAETEARHDRENKLALAELAEALLGGGEG
jgi:hypothetical protein